MAEANIVETSIDRVQEVFRSMEDELESIQKRLDKRRRAFEKTAQKRVKRIRKEIERQPLVKRAQTISRDTTRRIEQSVDGVLSSFQIASQSDLRRIDKKLNQISKKLSALEKATSREATPQA